MVFRQAGTAEITFVSQGNENAFGFSLSWDPAQLAYAGAALGSGATGASLHINSNLLTSGRIGLALALPSGTAFGQGTQQVLKVNYRSAGTASASTQISFADQPIPREASDALAKPLTVGYVAGLITVNPIPSLQIGLSGQNVSLSWPAWATNFSLRKALGASNQWEVVSERAMENDDQMTLTLPAAGEATFFRLRSD